MSNSCDPINYSLPGSPVHWILQARILEWVAMSFSRGTSWPRDWTRVSCIVGRRFIIWATLASIKPHPLVSHTWPNTVILPIQNLLGIASKWSFLLTDCLDVRIIKPRVLYDQLVAIFSIIQGNLPENKGTREKRGREEEVRKGGGRER